MCDRCGAGFTFFGLAEPQAALLDAFASALRAGWEPVIAASASDLNECDAALFFAQRADTIESSSPQGDMGPRRIRLVRWLWDGEFCGEVQLIYDATAEKDCRVDIRTSITQWKEGLRYRERAMRHLLTEARDLGVPLADLDRAALKPD